MVCSAPSLVGGWKGNPVLTFSSQPVSGPPGQPDNMYAKCCISGEE